MAPRRAPGAGGRRALGRLLALPLTVALACFAVLGPNGACGTFHEIDREGGGTSSDGATTGLDGAAGAVADGRSDSTAPALMPRACAIGKAFGAPVAVAVPGFSVESVAFSVDATQAYLSLCLGNSKDACDLFTAPVTAGTIGLPSRHPLSAAATYDAFPMFAVDGAFVVFTSKRKAPGPTLFTAVFDPVGQNYDGIAEIPLPFDGSNPMVYGSEPYLLRNNSALYFAAADDGGTDWDIYRASGAAPSFDSGNAHILTNMGELQERAPVVTDDDKELFFATDREGSSLDVWSMTKDEGKQPWELGHPEVVGMIATSAVEYPTWISPDACSLYFIRQNAGIGELWMATR